MAIRKSYRETTTGWLEKPELSGEAWDDLAGMDRKQET